MALKLFNEFIIQIEAVKSNSRITPLDFRKADFQLRDGFQEDKAQLEKSNEEFEGKQKRQYPVLVFLFHLTINI